MSDRWLYTIALAVVLMGGCIVPPPAFAQVSALRWADLSGAPDAELELEFLEVSGRLELGPGWVPVAVGPRAAAEGCFESLVPNPGRGYVRGRVVADGVRSGWSQPIAVSEPPPLELALAGILGLGVLRSRRLR